MKFRKQLTFIIAFAMCCGIGSNLIAEEVSNNSMIVSAEESIGVDWADAYIEYLNNVNVNKLGGFIDTTRFALAYIDDDDIPELLIIGVKNDDIATTSVATYYNGEVCTSTGFYGFGYGYSCQFVFTEKDNSILQDWEENEYTIYSIKDGHINVKHNLRGLYPGVVDNYYINDEVVSEKEFRSLIEDASGTTISYDDMLPFTCDIQAEVSKYVPQTTTTTNATTTTTKTATAIVTKKSSSSDIESGSCGDGEDENNVLYTLNEDGDLHISGISYIKEFAFNNNDKIKSLTLGCTVTGIEEGAFKDCTSLEDVKIDSHTTYINSQAFSGCSNLKKINLQCDDIEFIDKDAFRGCNSLEDILILDTDFDLFDTYIGYYYDDETSSYVKMSDFTVRGYIGSTAEEYANANGFKFVNVLSDDDTDNTEEFGNIIETGSCGDSCNYVAYHNDNNNVITISVNGTGKITNFEFGRELDNLFQDMYDKNITINLNIDEGITSIGNKTFDKFVGIYHYKINLSLPSTLESIEDFAFLGADIENINIPSSVKYISPTAFLYSGENFVVDEDNTSYTDVDGVLFTKDMKTLVQYPNCRTSDQLNGYTVPESVTKLYSTSFAMFNVASNTNDVSITIPCDADVEMIDDYYFGHTKHDIECVRYDSFTIYGYAGSGIEEYVNITNAEITADTYQYNDITFVPIERPTTTTTTDINTNITTTTTQTTNTNSSISNDGKNTTNNTTLSTKADSPITGDNGFLMPSILTLSSGLIAMFIRKRK